MANGKKKMHEVSLKKPLVIKQEIIMPKKKKKAEPKEVRGPILYLEPEIDMREVRRRRAAKKKTGGRDDRRGGKR